MDRYHDNVSPDPNSMLLPNNCYKTPDISSQYHLHSGINYHPNALYPTPPSDNDDTSSNSSYIQTDLLKSQNDFMNTPTITGDSFSSDNAKNDERQQINSIAKNNSSRYRRRSRTTYSKSQLDVLESTFQKTHYPEIRMVDDLSSMLNLSTERISIWFQNRRARFKKSRKLETTQENISYITPPPPPPPPQVAQTLITNSSPTNENNLNNSTQFYMSDKNYLNYGYSNFNHCKPILESKSIVSLPHSNAFVYNSHMHGQNQNMVPMMSNVNSHIPFSYSNPIDSSFYNQNAYLASYSSYQNQTP